ncbi:hypothetical protein M409DRAFT_63022 [Zasmidium cellare ATCC 36951]|uniref:PIN domain-like protein n=1 Tax=Zasmidium cellare ATCC 36951 TaxID=1080233 RepID=A0A6A6D1H2_ZASCE|nr:uncharacterized protein M409DRAFT_63022 [Zasmidium cellare ATCC 36951]KAF2172290.1 hypothetical protein M409DRAFT_63022 [Zasmidium cellare ATCC 36951]
MGVTGLWQIVQPCARPIKIETLNRKRLAVDASIWIYQFLKAVRDKEGNALRNSHVVGFFRRICKLLFFGIKPVFVFDGGAPALKRQTIRARKSRREGRRDDAVRTAGKLLAVQMQRRAEEEEAQRKAERDREHEQEETVPDEGLVYVDELQMTQQERQQNRKFRKKDQYHLPDLDVSLSEMSGANDPRVMSLEELQTYARQFDTGEDINVYDFSKIDYDSPFFMSLPASDRYNILNAARLRSRLRMGYSKDQLDTMYPDRMAFSKFQIERVRERNELTQRLMHLNGFEGTEFGGGRVAGEKGREYVLVKNDGVEGGWALGVITDEGKEEMPIDVDRPAPAIKQHQDEWEDEEDDFEDVSVAGLNRLPKRPTQNDEVADKLMEQRRAVYSSRKQAPKPKPKRVAKKDRSELFVQSSEDEEEDWEEVEEDRDLFGDGEGEGSEDEELRKAIALSLQKEDGGQGQGVEGDAVEDEDDDMLEVFQQSAVEEQKPVPKGSGRDIASIVNKRAFNTAPESREITYFGVPHEKSDESDESDTMDLQAALAESRKTKRKTSPPRRPQVPPKRTESATDIAKQAGFKGPLPFEKLDLGSSLLGKRKMQERTEETAGGFENPELAEKQKKKTAEPLPPWFSGDLEADIEAQNAIESEDRRRAREFENQFQFQDRGAPTLRRDPTNEVIDLEADDINEPSGKAEVINLEDDGEAAAAPVDHIMEKNQLTIAIDDDAPSVTPDRDVNMGDIADEVRAEPEKAFPDPSVDMADVPPVRRVEKEQPEERVNVRSASPAKARHADEEDEALDWSDSDHEEDRRRFEDVEIPDAPPAQREQEAVEEDDDQPRPPTLPAQETIPEDDDEFDDFSDPEEAEMLRQLTLEAEEHARFASSLNNKSTAQNIQEYEKELKQLRNQQKKDRRDADEVTQIMIQECQALLRLFGLPYITAPMEAEAQCAELVSMGLVDGIVTDDSDCFLFGGTRIYKNMFNQAKFVECYLTSDLEKEFDLSRDKLIAVAHLLGSDYTEGIPGIGPVTALEIISEFGSLTAFSDWWTAVQMNQISKEEDAKNPFRKKFRRNATKMFLPPGFPDERVNLAYKTPDVDHNPEAFQWGVPDLGALRSFLMATIGWTQERTDEVLVPVIKDMNRRLDEGTQANITHFFDGAVGIGAAGASSSAGKGEGFAPRKRAAGSKRMGNALTKMAEHAKRNRQLREGDVPCTEDGDAADEEEPTKGGNNTAKRRKTKATASANASATASDGDDSSEFNETRSKKTKGKKTAKATRGTSRKKKAVE